VFERILVPADLTERNRQAVEMARSVVAENGRIYLLHVIETIPGLSVDDEKEFYDKLEKKASEFLSELGSTLMEPGIEWTAEVVYGSRARTILEEARKLRADLIVVSSHRIDTERAGQGLGTLSYQVGVLAACPVLLVK